MQVEPGRVADISIKKKWLRQADTIKQGLWNFFSSGLPADYDLETLRIIFLINCMMFIGGIFLILLGATEFILKDYCLGSMNFAFFLFLAGLYIYLRKTKNYPLVGWVGITIGGIFFFSLIAYGGIGKTTYLWALTYPLIAVFLLGPKRGSVFSLSLLFAICVIFFFEPRFFASYDRFLKMRFIPTYLTIHCLAFIMEKTRAIIQLRFNAAKSELETTVEKLEKTNAAFEESDAQYRQIFESIQDVYYRTRLNGEILTISPSIWEVAGYDFRELVGQSVLELYADPLERDALVTEMMKSGRVTNYELTFKAKNGRKIISSVTGRLVYDDNGQAEGFAGVMRDITERKLSAEALQESEKRYRLLAENMTDNLWKFDLDTMRFSYLSPSVKGIIGYSAEEATGFELGDILTPSSRDLATKTLAEELLEADRHYDPSRSRTLEVEQYHKDGSTVWTEVSMRFIYDSEKRPVSVLGVTRDISERKKLQNQLQKSQKMESLGLLAGGVAHDLNNVLSGIVSYPELILMNLPADSKLKKPLETMRESGLRAAAIVQDLLTIARGVATANEPLSLNDAVRAYLNSPEFNVLRQYYPGVTVKTDLDAGLLNISASQVHIRKVVMNLVSNAAEAIKQTGNVAISTVNRYLDRPLKGYDEIRPGEYVVLCVSDNGSGISSNDLERIFEPFYTKKKMGRSGTGLGLSVVWNVVNDHKGYIDVTTDENGTTFELYFPVTRDAILKKDLPLSINNYKGNGEIILVIDDVQSQREISCGILDTLGYQAISASSGEEAIEYLKQNSADLLLLDMIMDPGLNGYETYKAIIKVQPGQKAIIVSGYSETDAVKKTQRLGAGKYVKKPLTIENMGLAVKAELER